ncbi:3' terminal RNA ribose 2'-O-methyltransferase Hen1 [Actinomadura rupiterrae]|uniref:3' terminal RNA ribose 2'-O-methyltransferase Hen1 n=1 Tax=Actinomadura rupiterrae TaxID=559627 RepID=UPI0020A42C29|nr:3' terminal RNA ribose 2'-O-methyltransferase Hen1 [Actinomadura rupiterrae]MCP2335895.1 3' terminal RNA ribose 2'-O-methyltransferase Hen1 [Actinomadura rupiterrae]
MLLTITTTRAPATDLGFLLHKHPGKVQPFEQASGVAHVFYPEADETRCTAALLLEVDPVKLVRTRGKSSPDFTLGQYVNDRPYAASSLLASAMAGVFRTAMRGRCDARPELPDVPLPLEIKLPALPCRGGPERAERYFAPLGWRVEAVPVPLDEGFPAWGDSRYVSLTLTGELRLADALNQLYVLLPVLDEAKHYWMAPDEVDKLIRAGEGWLAAHPDRAGIIRRYLANRRPLVRAALGRLADSDDAPEDALATASLDEELAPEGAAPEGTAPEAPAQEQAEEPKASLAEQRAEAVLAALHEQDARTVIDLGCGGGKLLARLKRDRTFEKVTGVDVSYRAVEMVHRRGIPDDSGNPHRPARVSVFQSALTYADRRFEGYDAAVLMEVVEHIDPPRLAAVEGVVFGAARPASVVVTTPNAEYNARYEGLAEGAMRHPDHRFEWTRGEFASWAVRVAAEHGYGVRYVPVGDLDPELGAPTQMAVFTRKPPMQQEPANDAAKEGER